MLGIKSRQVFAYTRQVLYQLLKKMFLETEPFLNYFLIDYRCDETNCLPSCLDFLEIMDMEL